MTKLGRRSLTVLVAVALPAALLMATPSAVPAKKAQKRVHLYFEGPINQTKDPGYTPYSHNCCFPSYVPTIQIEAKLGGTKQAKIEVTVYGIWSKCTGAEYADGESTNEITFKPKKKDGSSPFSGNHTALFSGTVTVAGQIVAKHTASGTARVVEDRGSTPDPAHAWGICDSGVKSWTATRVKALSDIHGSYNPNLIYPEGL
jgi:hypothetical protein